MNKQTLWSVVVLHFTVFHFFSEVESV